MSSDDALPPTLLRFGIPIAAIVLVSVFFFIGFPYAALGERIADELKLRHGIRLEYQEIGPGWILPGPAVVATDVRATLRDGGVLRVREAKLRPALSLAWFSGDPAVRFVLYGSTGNASGTLYSGDTGGWVGGIRQLDLSELPFGRYGPFSNMKGVVDATVDLRSDEAGPRGSVTFEAADGSLDLAGSPVSIPFDAFSGDLVFGDGSVLEVKRLALAGPTLSGTASGSVLAATSLANAPLKLDIEIEAEKAVGAMMQRTGMKIGPDGKIRARVTGTFSHPTIR